MISRVLCSAWPVMSLFGMLSPSALLAITTVAPGSKLVSWHESPVVLQSSMRSIPDTLKTVYTVANTDASQESTADCSVPVYSTFCGAQGTGKEMVEKPLTGGLRDIISKHNVVF